MKTTLKTNTPATTTQHTLPPSHTTPSASRRRKRQTRRGPLLTPRRVAAAQVIGATIAYWLLSPGPKTVWQTVAAALLLGTLGVVKHRLEAVLRRPCRRHPTAHFAAITLAAFLGVCLYHTTQHLLA